MRLYGFYTMRALIITRLSKQVEESTSAERQRKDCEELCQREGWEVIGVAEDLNVSAGKTSPFERPELSKWIGDGKTDEGRMHEIDVIVFWRLDRVVRSIIQMADLLRWLEQYGVAMKSATEPHIDLTKPMGKLIPMLVTSFAEMELEAIRERITADQQHRLKSGKYRGARTPLGYKAVKAEDGSKVLVPEPEQVKLVHEIIADLFAGKTASAIARDLNERGVPSALDLHRKVLGKKPLGGKWHGAHIHRALQSPTLLGQIEVSDPILDKRGRPVLKNGKKQYGERYVLRDESGNPIVRAEPIISVETYSKVQKLIEDRSLTVTNPREALSLLTGVLYCGYCGAPAYKMAQYNGRRHRYRCNTRQNRLEKCDNPVATVDYEWINNTFEEFLTGLMRGAMRRTRVWDPGENTAEEQAELELRLEDLIPQLGRPPYTPGSTAYELLQENITTISNNLEELKKQTTIDPGWRWESTGESFNTWWRGLSVADKNRFLKESDVRIEYRNRPDRKRGDTPDIDIQLDLEMLNGDYAGDFPAREAADIVKEIPDGYTAHVRGTSVELENREAGE